jgi:hypothetical protein
MKKSPVYKHQNVAIHKTRAQLEPQGILDPWSGVDQIREMAARDKSRSPVYFEVEH